MTAVRIEQFLGSRPVISDWLLPQNAGSEARNCKVRSGSILPIIQPRLIHQLPAGTPTQRFFYRIVTVAGEVWFTHANADVSLVESPLVNDTYRRIYWTIPGARPRYSTASRIAAGEDPYYLGIAAPPRLTVTPPDGDTKETRSYVYTRVSSMGEESAPSAPRVASGDPSGIWALTDLGGEVSDPANYDLEKIRIYRTVTGTTTAGNYFFVAELPIDAVLYNDNVSNATAALNNVLSTGDGGQPPTGLSNLTVMPNGFLVGSVGRDIWFSEPWKPHSWPAKNVISVDADVVAFAVVGTTLFILTNSTPYLATGVRPEAISLSRTQTVAPCVSRRSVVTHPQLGVLYASHNGLIRLTPGGAELVTRDLIDEREWGFLVPNTLSAALDDVFYIAYNENGNGFLIDVQQVYLISLKPPLSYSRVWTDRYSGEALVQKNDRVYTWDPADGEPSPWYWRSKQFDMAKPVNIGAVQIRWNSFYGGEIIDLSAKYVDWNEERIKTPLSPLGWAAIGSSRKEERPGLDPDLPQNRNAASGPILFLTTGGVGDTGTELPSLHFTLTASSAGKVFDGSVPDGRVIRPKAGHKARAYQFELAGNVEVQSVALAETGRELMEV